MSASYHSRVLLQLFLLTVTSQEWICGERLPLKQNFRRPTSAGRSQKAAWRTSVSRATAGDYVPLNNIFNGANITVNPASGSFFTVDLQIGSPPQSFQAFIDTGSDLSFVPCFPCPSCDTSLDTVLFKPELSSTFNIVDCQECASENHSGDNSQTARLKHQTQTEQDKSANMDVPKANDNSNNVVSPRKSETQTPLDEEGGEYDADYYMNNRKLKYVAKKRLSARQRSAILKNHAQQQNQLEETLAVSPSDCGSYGLNHAKGNGTCVFNVTFIDQASVSGFLGSDTLSLDSSVSFPKFIFGCATNEVQTNGVPSLLGLGRGGLSMVSQLSTSFSYCMPEIGLESPGFLQLGEKYPHFVKDFTHLFSDPTQPSFYFVDLRGLSVNGKAVQIAKEYLEMDAFFNPHAGTVIDSGTTFTSLRTEVYLSFRDAFRQAMESEGLQRVQGSRDGFDTCYEFKGKLKVPRVTMIFDRFELQIPPKQTFVRIDENLNCLAFQSVKDISIWGYYQQQNLLLFYDTKNSRLGMARHDCSSQNVKAGSTWSVMWPSVLCFVCYLHVMLWV